MEEGLDFALEGNWVVLFLLRILGPAFRQSRAGSLVEDPLIVQVIYENFDTEGNWIAA